MNSEEDPQIKINYDVVEEEESEEQTWWDKLTNFIAIKRKAIATFIIVCCLVALVAYVCVSRKALPPTALTATTQTTGAPQFEPVFKSS